MYMKCVLIIGGNCDIGRSLTKYFLDKKYNVVVGYHNDTNEYYEDVKYFKCDVTNVDSINNIIKNTIDMYGNIDMIINLSCICMDNSFLNKTKEELMKEIEVNLVGMFLCNQIYSRYINDGIIINMASTDGIDTYSEYSIGYSMTKAGIINISKSISLSTKNKVLCIAPNWIESSSTINMDSNYLYDELKRIGQDRLISLDELVNAFDKIINSNFNSGDIFRIDVKESGLWVEKM